MKDTLLPAFLAIFLAAAYQCHVAADSTSQAQLAQLRADPIRRSAAEIGGSGSLGATNRDWLAQHGTGESVAAAGASGTAVLAASSKGSSKSKSGKKSGSKSGKKSGSGSSKGKKKGTRLVLISNNKLGAQCLDGSPPGYYLRPGSGGGSDSWHIHFPGGGWCTSDSDCAGRAKTDRGSTDGQSSSTPVTRLVGALSSSSSENPVLYNWNLAMPVYCDGGGYAGGAGRRGKLNLDGDAIVKAIVDDLVSSQSMSSASRVLVSGCSAGGLPVARLCDWLGGRVPSASVKCLIDGSMFTDSKDRSGSSTFRNIAQAVTSYHQPTSSPCSRSMGSADQWKCFFPLYAARYVSSPVFIANAVFDPTSFRIGAQVADSSDTHIRSCLQSLIAGQGGSGKVANALRSNQWKGGSSGSCSGAESQAAQGAASAVYRGTADLVAQKRNIVAYIETGAVQHCMVTGSTWTGSSMNGTKLRDAVGNWVSGRSSKNALYI